MAKKKREIRWLIPGSVIVVLFALLVYLLYTSISFKGDKELYVYPGYTWERVESELNGALSSTEKMVFRTYLSYAGGKKLQVTPGYYSVEKGDRIDRLIRRVANGRQTPVRITFNNLRTKAQLAGRLSSQLMVDSTTLVNALNDPAVCEKVGQTPYTVIALFIPDTYEVYWSVTPEELLKRMNKEYKFFWNEERTRKLRRSGLNREEVSTLASIIESESNLHAEQQKIAGTYLNRLRIGMPLQACPTAIFASGDFTITRVTSAITNIQSPYNTYNRRGLPIGPIRIPSKGAIDAVLDFQQSNYIYFCAKPDGSGTHTFTSSFAEHKRNAAHYQKMMFKRKKS